MFQRRIRWIANRVQATGGAAIVLLAMSLYQRGAVPRPVLLPLEKDKGSPSKTSKPLLFELMSAR